MKVGIAQIRVKDSFDKNIEHIITYIEKANDKNIDILCFPECSMVGYVKILKNGRSSFVDTTRLQKAIEHIHKHGIEKDINVIVGSVSYQDNDAFNAALVLLCSGERKHYFKNNLTDEELKYFKSGSETLVFDINGLKFGTIICRDQNYPLLSLKYKDRGIHGLFVLAAHYYKPEEAQRKRDKNRALPIARALENSFYVFKANAVGEESDYVSLGGSLMVSPEGVVLTEADDMNEVILNYEIPCMK
jgi:predicted amidohydrolase